MATQFVSRNSFDFSWIFCLFLVQIFVSYLAGLMKSRPQFKPTKNNGDQLFCLDLSFFILCHYFVFISSLLSFFLSSSLFYVLSGNNKDDKA